MEKNTENTLKTHVGCRLLAPGLRAWEIKQKGARKNMTCNWRCCGLPYVEILHINGPKQV